MFKRKVERTLQITEHGFIFKQGKTLLRYFSWADINEIIAWKRDDLTTDTLFFGFRSETDEAEAFCYIREDTAGFKELTEAIAKELPGFDRDWHAKVARPAFELCLTTLYKKAGK